MLSVFDAPKPDHGTTGGRPGVRIPQLLGLELDTAPQETVTAAAPEMKSPALAQPVEPTFRKASAASPASHPPSVQMPSPTPGADVAVSAEFQRFSEQFTRSFLEALARAVSDIHALVVEDRRKLETAFNSFSGASREMEALRAQVASLSQRLDSMASAQQESSLRLGRTEDALRNFSSANGSLQEFAQSFGRRLDLQADAIRTVHGAVQERDRHMEEVRVVLKALQDVGGDAAVSEAALKNL